MTDDIDTEDEMTLAAEYALGLLAPAEAEAFEAVLAVDPDLRDQYAQWAESFASLTDDIAPVAPPPALEARIQEAIFGRAEVKPSIWSRLGLWGPALGGVAAALVVLAVLNQSGIMDDPGPSYVAELAAEDASLIVQATFDPDARTLVMDRTAGRPREGRALEVWLIAGDSAPQSLGVWPTGQTTATLTLSETIATQMEGGVLAISDEPPGGSPTGAPSGDVLAVGAVTLLL